MNRKLILSTLLTSLLCAFPASLPAAKKVIAADVLINKMIANDLNTLKTPAYQGDELKIETESGDLDDDDIDDVVALVTIYGTPYIVVVLHGEANGDLKPWFQTKISEAHGWSNSVHINKDSIFISEYYGNTAVEFDRRFQFKFRDGKFLLIGAESEDWTKENDSENWSLSGEKVSVNYLTNKVIYSHIEKSDNDNEKTTHEKTSNIAHQPLLDFTQFEGGNKWNMPN